jgi:glycosyltransferase involved in cell wall biosynthesis
MKISFIIPCLNEEKDIESSVKQFHMLKGEYDYEVIVSDGGSDDKTARIARKAGAKVVINDRKTQTIARNRNNGARKAKGDLLIFCDADTRIKDMPFFAERVLKIFADKKTVAGMPKIQVFPEERIWKDCLFSFFYNNIIRFAIAIRKPLSSGQCQIVRKTEFWKVGGYTEDLVYAEDSDLFRKLGKIGRLHYFSDLVVYESPRRYRKWGYIKLGTRALINAINQSKKKKVEWERVG